MAKKSRRAICEELAAHHGITIDFHFWKSSGVRCYQYSVDLPDGMITESGNTGRYGEDDIGDNTAAEIWGYILDDMEGLIAEEWMTISEHEALQAGAK